MDSDSFWKKTENVKEPSYVFGHLWHQKNDVDVPMKKTVAWKSNLTDIKFISPQSSISPFNTVMQTTTMDKNQSAATHPKQGDQSDVFAKSGNKNISPFQNFSYKQIHEPDTPSKNGQTHKITFDSSIEKNHETQMLLPDHQRNIFSQGANNKMYPFQNVGFKQPHQMVQNFQSENP